MEVFQSADTATHITQVKCFEEFPKQEVPWNVIRKTEAQLTQRCITQWQEFVRGQDSPQMEWRKEPSPWDDAKAFLASFEQVAQACQWPREEWAARLLPALRGEAQQAFGSLEAGDREDYGKVKAAILRVEANLMETLRQHFRQFRSQAVEDPRQIYSQLQELCRLWLRLERHSKEQILELLILEQFLAILPPELQSRIRAGCPENCTQAAVLVEDFLGSHPEAEIWSCQAPPDLKEKTISLGEAEGTVPEAGPRPMYWEVMEESYGNADPFGRLLVPKLELKQEETQYSQACEDGATFPAGVGILSMKENEISPQGRPELTELPEALPGYSQSNGLLRPEAYEARPSSAQPQKSHQGKEHEELTGTDERTANRIAESLKVTKRGCPEYRHKTSFSSDLIRHMGIHAGGGSYRCNKCGKTFRHKAALNGHQRIHTSKKTPCGRGQSLHCASSSESQRMLQDDKEPNKWRRKKAQKESNEPEEGNITLPEASQNMIPEAAVIPEQECELKGHPKKELAKNQNDPIRLVEHNSSAEEDTRTVWVKKLLYLQGGKICLHRSGPVSQESPHIVEKPCGRPANGQPILRRRCLKGNQRIHTGEKLHKCPEDWKRLWSGWVMEHQKIRAGEKPSICPKCGKRFRWRSWLRRHQEAHT